MHDVNWLLDQAKEATKIETDMALAKALGVGRGAVSGWRHGTRQPDPVACAALAGLTGIPLAKVLGIVGEARAISREEKAVWRKLAATAAVVLLGVGITLPSHTESTNEKTQKTLVFQGFSHELNSIHYAKCRIGALNYIRYLRD